MMIFQNSELNTITELKLKLEIEILRQMARQ